ncbi:MAG: general secretion pathway protein GspE [Planctomycetaceae bacterium]|nr:general secretion pathway protein GspE [Planctomycetaceae bacterium]
MAIDVYKDWLGIPEGERPPHHYDLLRLVKFEDDEEKIRAHYKKLNAHVRKYASGKYSNESQELLNELAKAMLCLTDPERKHEYDESLGREPVEENDDEPRTTLDYLVVKGLIKRSQVGEIEHFASARGLTHRDAVIQMKLVEPADATRALAVELRLPFVDLEDMLPEDSVLDQVPRRTVKKFSCLPLFEDRGRLLVACTDEPSVQLEDEIRLRFGFPMRAVLAVPRSINQAIARYYAPGMRDEAAGADATAGRSSAESGKKEKPTKQKPARKVSRSEPLSKEEKAQRMQLSLIGICWSIIGTVGICYLTVESLGMLHYGLSLFVGVVTFGILKLTYWK